MQVLYGLDTTLDDGIANPNQYVPITAVPDPTQIVSVQITLEVNSIDRVSAEDGVLRRTFSKTLLVRNANPEL
jgi:hypothetical protein